MRLFVNILMVLISLNSICGQQIQLRTNLDSKVEECSGALYLNDKVIVHNDSGNKTELYELDSITGMVTRSVYVANATNVDWEDICADSSYIYIGDFGNNQGSRQDLKIYRISISGFFNNSNDTVNADSIEFSYQDQTDFTPSSFATNFDAEAMITIKDSLFIFTKNWGDFKSNVYGMSKQIGSYALPKLDSLNTQGLITGATYNYLSNSVVLTGYSITPFIIELHQIVNQDFSGALINKYNIQPQSSNQIEGITTVGYNRYFLLAEKQTNFQASLYSLKGGNSLGLNKNGEKGSFFYPNPASENIRVEVQGFIRLELFSLNGELAFTTHSREVDITELQNGTYLVKAFYKNEKVPRIASLVINK